MNKKYLIIIALVVVILILTTTKTGKELTAMAEDKVKQIADSLKAYSPEQLKNVTKVSQALLNQGVSRDVLPFILAQVAFETGHYKNAGARIDNNFSGIRYFGQSGATAGTPAPKNEGSAPYAHYADANAWAKDYIRILNKVGNARPLEAKTPEQFAHALKLNRYYTADEAQYTQGIKSLYKNYILISKIV